MKLKNFLRIKIILEILFSSVFEFLILHLQFVILFELIFKRIYTVMLMYRLNFELKRTYTPSQRIIFVN
jgi:hypothetical protein